MGNGGETRRPGKRRFREATMKSLSWILVCGALCLPSPGRAEDTWETVGPYGGWINDLFEDVSGRILAATSFGGIYRSSDDGESWQQIFNGDLIFDPRCVATNASGHIFVGSEGIGGVGFLRSTDDGASWQVVNNTLASKMVTDLVVTPAGDLYACTFADGLFRSTNNGTTFTHVASLPALYTTRVEPGSAGHLFVGVQYEQVNLYRSTDNGATWQPGDAGIVYDVVDVHSSGPVVYAADASGVYKSTDSGVTWTNLGAPSGFGYNSVTVASNGDIAASVFANIYDGGIVVRSTDDGATWAEDPGLGGRYVDGLLSTSGGMTFAAGKGPGVHRHVDESGAPWELKVNGMVNTWITSIVADETGGVIYAGTANALVFRSLDSGLTWQRVDVGIPPFESIYDMGVNTDGTVFASGAYDGIYRSTDQGDTWTSVHFAAATAIACNALGHVFAGHGSRMYRSTNNGIDWTFASLPTVQYIADIAFDENRVYAATGAPGGFGSKGVYLSTNNGDTWAAFNNGLTDLGVTTIAVGDPGGPAACRISAGTSASGVFDLSESGTWVQDPGLNSGNVISIRKNGPSERTELLAKLEDLWEIADEFECNRHEVPASLRSHIAALEARLGRRGRGVPATDVVWVGTVGHGIFRRTTSDPAGVFGEAVRGSSLGPNDPNPFDRSTVIEFEVAEQGFVELKVFDASGREVETLVSGQSDPGRHRITWDAGDRPGGVYFSRLSTARTVQSRSLVLLK
jgi:photosystem II stability/assembly factor-like uncharacterized protein